LSKAAYCPQKATPTEELKPDHATIARIALCQEAAMPSRSHRRALLISYRPLTLIGCIAAGLWLGFMAIVLTAWLLWRQWGDALQPLPVAAPPAPAPQERMFEQYQQNLRQLDQPPATGNARGMEDPKCKFWLQQDRTAPSEKSRANVQQFCG
jgi:hypothetical protein